MSVYKNIFLNKNKMNVDKLPYLPIPDLEQTIEKYHNWVAPLINENDRQQMLEATKDFLKKEAPILQKKLLEKAKTTKTSWLIDWWHESYLSSRGPISPEVGAVLTYRNENFDRFDKFAKATLLSYIFLLGFDDFIKNKMGNSFEIKGKKISLDQIQGLYSSYRDVRKQMDKYHIIQNDDYHENYVILIIKDRFFELPIFNKEGKLIPINLFYNQIKSTTEKVLSESNSIFQINGLTATLDRDQLADKLKEIHFSKDDENKIKKIQEAVFILSYDETNYSKIEDLALNGYVGEKNYLNRWLGKSLHLIFNDSNTQEILMEHTFIDGATINYIIEKYQNNIDLNLSFKTIKSIPKLKEIIFNQVNIQTQELIIKYKKDYYKYCNDLYRIYYENNYISRQKLKELGVKSADSFFHLGLQIAQLKSFNEIKNVYIAVDVRNFYNGRTECVRPISDLSLNVAKAIVENKYDKKSIIKDIESIQNIHHSRIKECQLGQGINRHLLGLYKIYQENREQFKNIKFFETKAWSVINENYYSTSSINNPNLKLIYWPVVKNGFGLSYAINNSLYSLVTSFNKDKEKTKLFVENLNWALNKLLEIFNG